MDSPEQRTPWDPPSAFWQEWVLPRLPGTGSLPWLPYASAVADRRAHNVAETRLLLARVYGVPEASLDDVMRLRLADLDRAA